MLERWIILNLFEFYANDLGGEKKDDNSLQTTLCSEVWQRDFRGSLPRRRHGRVSTRRCSRLLPVGDLEILLCRQRHSVHKSLCRQRASPAPGSRECQGIHTSFQRSGNFRPKKQPLRSLPWNTSYKSPETLQIALRADSQLPPASGERIKPATLQDSQRISESKR